MARGRKRTRESLPSNFNQEKYDAWMERIVSLEFALENWKTDPMALSDARTHTASLNSGIRNMSIDPEGSLTRRNSFVGIVKKVLSTQLGRPATADEITRMVNLMESAAEVKADEVEVG